MRWLLIEDDDNKTKQITAFIENTFKQDIEVVRKRSYQSGLTEIFENTYDLIILDMSMPTFDISQNDDGYEDGYAFKHLAGKEILEEIKRYKKFTKTIVLTQFESFIKGGNLISLDELKNMLKEKFSPHYLGTIYYHAAETNWKKELEKIILDTFEIN